MFVCTEVLEYKYKNCMVFGISLHKCNGTSTIQKCRERECHLVLVVGRTELLCIGDTTTHIDLATVMVPKSNHASSHILFLVQWLYPLLGCLSLKEALQQLMNLMCISLKDNACQHGARDRSFVKSIEHSVHIAFFHLVHNVRERYTIDTPGCRNIVPKCWFPLCFLLSLNFPGLAALLTVSAWLLSFFLHSARCNARSRSFLNAMASPSNASRFRVPLIRVKSCAQWTRPIRYLIRRVPKMNHPSAMVQQP
jgi:hypothetical protein